MPNKIFKNQTPRGIAWAGSLLSSIGMAILLVFSKVMGYLKADWWFLALLFVFFLVVDFWSNSYFIRHFIFRKIKLIYKVIQNHKLPTDFSVNKLNMRSDVLEEVEAEVAQWVNRQSEDMKKMEELAQYRRQFLGNVSHELKTPIFNIQGFLHTLLDGGLDDPEINVKYLERAASNAERLQHIVEDLETINKLENEKMVLDIRDFDIKKLVQEVFEDNELNSDLRNIELKFKEGADLNFSVLADRESIRQVLMNLVTNAIKYGRAGGRVLVGFYDMDKKVLVEVSDDGIGIKEEHLPYIFDRFYRVDKGRSRGQGGTGLGLSIVKHIIEAHKETMNARSTENQGSTFGFTLQKSGKI